METDFGLALIALMEGPSKLTREQAIEHLAYDPGTVDRLAPKQRKVEERKAAEAAARTPEALAAAALVEAEEVEAAKAERTRKADLGRGLLVARGQLDEESAAGLSEGEALHNSGIDRSDWSLWSLKEKDVEADRVVRTGEWAKLGDDIIARQTLAGNLGASPNAMDEYHNLIFGGEEGVESSDSAGEGSGAEGGGDGE